VTCEVQLHQEVRQRSSQEIEKTIGKKKHAHNFMHALVKFLFQETNNPTNERIVLDSFKWAQMEMEMKNKSGLVVSFMYPC
jgi:hypothetical protein